LHLIAALRGGAFRFHAAGMLRELHCIGEAVRTKDSAGMERASRRRTGSSTRRGSCSL
jgi:hypothetical protein